MRIKDSIEAINENHVMMVMNEHRILEMVFRVLPNKKLELEPYAVVKNRCYVNYGIRLYVFCAIPKGSCQWRQIDSSDKVKHGRRMCATHGGNSSGVHLLTKAKKTLLW